VDLSEATLVLSDHQARRTLWQRMSGQPGLCGWCLAPWPCPPVEAALAVVDLPDEPPNGEWHLGKHR